MFAMLMAALMAIYVATDSFMQTSQNTLGLHQECRLSLDSVLKELRQADPSSIAINEDQNSVTFKIPQSIDIESGAITWSAPITYSIGGINNAQLIRTQAGVENAIMANDVNNNLQDSLRLRFVADAANPGLISVRMSLRKATLKGNFSTAVLTGQVKLRNNET